MSSRHQVTADRPAESELAPGADQPNGADQRAGADAAAQGQPQAARADAVDAPERASAAGLRPARRRLPTRVPAGGRPRAEARPAPGGQAGSAPDTPVAPVMPAGDIAPGEQLTTEPVASAREPVPGLSARLVALAGMIQIASTRTGRDAFAEKLLAEAGEVLARAGERMRLSSNHTVVVLAGGTGSGKSSLFNRIAGADFSEVGVTRPVTTEAHACIWGDAGSGAILDWLDIPSRFRYARDSELDPGEDELAGLLLVDLPDHDSVMNQSGEVVGRLVGMADVMIWVLDPQKYADGAVHKRFLAPMAGHSAVLVVVMNQSDLLEPSLVHDCVADLRRLLDSEDLHDVPILLTSAVTGAGVDDLRGLLADGVAVRRAAATRIAADVDQIVARFKPFAGELDTPVGGVPLTSRLRLADRFAAAAGISAVADALRTARELRAADFIGWPVAWFVQRISGRNPLRKVRLGMLWNDLRSITAGPAGAQQAEIDNALTDLGNDLAEPLPQPWSRTVRAAVRSRAEQIPPALGAAIAEALPEEDAVVWWWRLTGVWQGLLLGAAIVAVAWFALILAFGVFHAATGAPALLSRTSAAPWVVALAGAALVLGAVTASVCTRLVVSVAEREKTLVTAAMKERIAGVADDMVIDPAEQELAELERFRAETRIASRGVEPARPAILP